MPNDLADVTWYLSNIESRKNINPIMIAQDDVLGFVDASQGYLSHAWHVSEDSTYMLNGPIVSASLGYDYYIDESIPHTCDDETIAVLFKKEGMHSVRLRNTFSTPVRYRYLNDDGGYTEIHAAYEDGVYVIDTTFTVEVYGTAFSTVDAIVSKDKYFSEIVPTGYLPGSDTEVYSVEVEFGKSLYFKDNSYYKPNLWSWTCAGAGISTAIEGEVISMPFNKLTSNPVRASLTVERDNTVSGWTYTKAIKSTKKEILLDITVVAAADEDPSLYDVEMGISDQRTLQVVMSNTPFDDSYTFADVLKEYADEDEIYACATVDGNPYYCTAMEVDATSSNKLNLYFGSDGNTIFGTDKSMYLTVNKLPLNSSNASQLSFTNKKVSASWATGNLFNNPDNGYGDIGNIDNLFQQVIKYSGLDVTSDKFNTLEKLNNSILFKNAIKNFYYSNTNDYGGSMIDISIVFDPLSGPSNDTVIDSNFTNMTDLALKLEVLEAGSVLYCNQVLRKSTISRYFYQCDLYFVPTSDFVASGGMSAYVDNQDSGISFIGTYDDDGVATVVNAIYYYSCSNLYNAANGYRSGFKPYGNKSLMPYTALYEDNNLTYRQTLSSAAGEGCVFYLKNILVSNEI